MKKNNVIKFKKGKGKTKVIYPYGRAEVIQIKKKKKDTGVLDFFKAVVVSLIFLFLGILIAGHITGH